MTTEPIILPKAILQTADTPEELENAPQIPVENLEITPQEVLKQLPPEVQGAMGSVVRYGGMWAVKLPDLVVTKSGQKRKIERFLSHNGQAMRAFHTKEQAEKALEYYQELMIARAVLREEQEKRAALEKNPPEPSGQLFTGN